MTAHTWVAQGHQYTYQTWLHNAHETSALPKEPQTTKNDESRRSSLPQERAQQLAIQYKMTNKP